MRFVAERRLLGWIVDHAGTELIATFDLENDGEPTGLYAELRSFDPNRKHITWDSIAHKRVRITVEVID